MLTQTQQPIPLQPHLLPAFRAGMEPNVHQRQSGPSRPTAAMRDTECFMKIEMADIGSITPGSGKANLGIEICAVEVNLSANSVDSVAYLLNKFFKNTVRRWVRDHYSGDAVCIAPDLGVQIPKVDIAVLIAVDDYDFHACHVG